MLPTQKFKKNSFNSNGKFSKSLFVVSVLPTLLQKCWKHWENAKKCNFFAFQSYLHKESQTSASQLFRKETYFETKDSDDDSDYETSKYKSKRYQKSHSMKKSSSTASSNKSQEIIDENNMT